MILNFNTLFAVVSYIVISTLINHSYANDKVPMLKLTPEICVVEHKQQRCKTLLVINYVSDSVKDYCVVIPAQGVKHCVDQQHELTLEVEVDTQKDLAVYIEDKHNATLYSDAVFRVSEFKPKTRRKRSFGWNFL